MNSTAHHRMLGAAVVHRLPGLQRSPFALERAENGLFLLWLAWMGVLLLATFLLWRAGAWHRLVAADPTFLTVVITLLFFGCSLWAGRRAWVLGQQRQQLDVWIAQGAPSGAGPDWAEEYRRGCAAPGADRSTWMQVLGGAVGWLARGRQRRAGAAARGDRRQGLEKQSLQAGVAGSAGG